MLAAGGEDEYGRAWGIGIEMVMGVVVLDAKKTECSFTGCRYCQG